MALGILDQWAFPIAVIVTAAAFASILVLAPWLAYIESRERSPRKDRDPDRPS
jgi:hypothetical protein